MKALLLMSILILDPAINAQEPVQQRREIVTTWERLVNSIDTQNPVLTEIFDSYRKYPPWIVSSPVVSDMRRERLKKAIQEAETQAKALRELLKAEGNHER